MLLLYFFRTVRPDPIAVTLGPLQVRWYGLCLALGVAAGYLLARRAFQRAGRAVDELEELLLGLVLCGLVGARLLDVFLFEWWYFSRHLSEVWYVWQGGLAFHGGLLGGAVYLWWFSRRRSLRLLVLADLLAPALALGQAIGRWGNYFNQELFGLPTNLPWGITISPQNRPAGFEAFTTFHPTFLYESLLLGLLAVALVWFSRRKPHTGQVFALYLIASGVIRFSLEFLRLDVQSVYFSVRAGIWVALTVIALGVGLWLWVRRTTPPRTEAAPR